MKQERIQIRKAMDITGHSLRSVQHMAAKGLIPGAAKLGGIWTFDEVRLRHWVREGEKKAWRAISTGEEKSGGAEYRSLEGNIERAYELLFGRKPSSGSTHGARK